MYDSTNPYDIPTSAQMVAYYMDGLYAWDDNGIRRFSGKPMVSITVLGNVADVADVETGDLRPVQGAAWAAHMISLGRYPVLYFSRYLYGTVAAAIHAQGINDSQWAAWIAEWTGIPHLISGTVATQYDHPPHSGGHYDLSLVGAHWPGKD